MKISQNVGIFVGDQTKNERFGTITEKGKEQKKADSIFAGSLNGVMDPIVQKRKEAQKKAMKVVGDAFANEQKIDSDLQERKDHISQLRGTIKNAQEALNGYEQDRETLRESMGTEADSQEQSDLELLIKRSRSSTSREVSLTDEDQKRLAEIDKNGLTEYQERAMQIDSYGGVYRTEIKEARDEILEENSIIREVRLERLKTHPMEDAQKEAEQIKAAASDEVVGLLVEEAKDHIDEEKQEKEDAAEKKAEEEAKQQEQLDAIHEKKIEMEQLADPDKKQEAKAQEESAEIPTENLLKLDQTKTDVHTEVENIVDKMKLIAEDIKGAAVDTQV